MTTIRHDVMSSPRSWRCFLTSLSANLLYFVFSTLVEVFLGIARLSRRFGRLLHARGGVSDE